jgi:large subunit ribosomal protein L33
MAKKKGREHITLECGVCGDRNYYTEKNKVVTTTRLELKKYCKRCRKATSHKETK